MTRIFKKTIAGQLPMYFIIWVCLAIFLVSCGSDERDDQLDTNPISPSSSHWGEVISIAGHDFGDEQESGIVLFGGDVIASRVISWSDTEIRCIVPFGSTTGPVTVFVNNVLKFSANFVVEDGGEMIVHLKPSLNFSSQLIEDISGNQNHAIVEGSVEWVSDQFGNLGKAICLQGDGAHAVLRNEGSLKRFARLLLSANIDLNESRFVEHNSMTIFHKDSCFSLEAISTGQGVELVLSVRDKDRVWSLAYSNPQTDPLPNGFFKATAIFDSSKPLLSIYVDDELVASNSNYIGEIIADVTDQVYIGTNPHEQDHFSGIIEEAFIF